MAVRPGNRRIEELVESELSVENESMPPQRQEYNLGWVTGAAMEYFSATLARSQESALDRASLIEELCAEIGFWRGLVDMHRMEKGLKHGPRRKLN